MRTRPKRAPLFGAPGEANSLFGEILDWMLAPLLLLWPISIAATHHVANDIANQPYDKALAENVEVIASLVQTRGGRTTVNLPAAARTILRADEQDEVYFQVRGAQGKILAGDQEISLLPANEVPAAGEVRFRDDNIGGEPIRIAYRAITGAAGGADLLVQVAETRHKREALASRIISGVLLPQFAIIPVAVILVWLGLSRGLNPLNRLRGRIAARRPGDLSPVGLRGVPEELQPMIRSFNELMARLEQNLQAQQRFIADAAHQMRTPITGLKTQAELAAREDEPEQLRRSVEQIAKAAERAGHLINQLLMLARAESSHDKVHRFEVVDLEALALEITRDWVPRAMARRIDLGFEGTGAPLLIDGVPLLLRELLTNLVDNAVKYTPAEGRVTVMARVGASAVLEVIDTGIGIAEADRERVFERFYRVLGTGAEGSGLGLPICAEIAELHRATIALREGDMGVGTRAVVTFPLSRRHHRVANEARPSAGEFPLA